MSYTISTENAHELRELIEDSIQYFCDENMVSGELAWIMVQAVAEANIALMKGEVK